MNELNQLAAGALERLRNERPLLHLISNYVTMNDVANATLAIGARPVMAHAAEEVAEITRVSRALVLNLGTPSPERVEAMLAAGREANAHAIPILFDPVGAGASAFRSESSARILNSLDIAVIRGNAGEIGSLAGEQVDVSGVDSLQAGYDRASVAGSLAAKYHTTIVISGAEDVVGDNTRIATVENGTSLLQHITGAGDMLDAVIAAALAIERDTFVAATCGLVWYGVAAEQAARGDPGLGTFRTRLFDCFGNLAGETILANGKVKSTGSSV